MSMQNSTDVDEPDFSTTSNYNQLNGLLVEKSNNSIVNGHGATNYGQGGANYAQGGTNYGAAAPFIWNNGSFYMGDETLLNQKLILEKELKSSVDIRYKSHYFPGSGPNVGIPQTPRYVRTVDDGDKIVIKFPMGFIKPPNPDDYYLEVFLLAVSQTAQHHKHTNKFQRSNTDIDVPDENPLFIPLTEKNLDEGEIRIPLVLIKSRNSELQNIKSLPLFDEFANPNETTDCKTIDELKGTYALNHALIAFSLGYFDVEDRFFRFPSTTVVSNKIIETEQSEDADNVTCPGCSHRFNFKEQKKIERKRSALESNASNKKRSSKKKIKN